MRQFVLIAFLLAACTSNPPAGVDGGVDASVPDAMPDAEPQCSVSKPCENASRPVCKEGSCVSCDENTFPDMECEALDADTPVCDPVSGACVACLENTSCKSATASRCNPDTNTCETCESDNDCTHIDGKGVCSPEGTCVECTPDKDTACTSVCVIEPITEEQQAFTCDNTIEPEKTLPCVPCVSSKQCLPGASCVAMKEGDVELGNYCLWDRDSDEPGAPAGSCKRPFVRESEARAIDGLDEATFCISRTATCLAFSEVSSKSCDENLVDPGLDGQCGHPDVNGDAYCVQLSGEDYRCTIPCLGDQPDDCPIGFNSCAAPPKGRTDIPTQKVCAL